MESKDKTGPRAGSWPLVIGLGALALTLATTSVTTRPPAALPADAPSSVFSADRTVAVLSNLLKGNQPHPAGSEANREVRSGIWQTLVALGYQPQLQREAVCGESGTVFAVVENVVARLEGNRTGKMVMLSCHYDSVAAGPGAGDDGSGVASMLEIARILKEDPKPDNSILFFFGEGEEIGLLGAEAFVQKHPWATDVGAIVNMEARGTSGRSWMFETSPKASWLIRLYARQVVHPATSSIAYAIYKRLPNDTDLTVYKRVGLQGIGLAFIGDVQRYHTPVDDIARLSRDTVQQQGETALAMTRVLASADLMDPVSDEAIFFDIGGLVTVWWPEVWSIYLSVAAVVALIVSLARLASLERLSGREFAWGFLAWPVMIGLTCGAAIALGWLLDAQNVFPSAFPARPWPAVAAFWCVGLICPLLVAAVVGRKAGIWGLWAGTLFWWITLALATTLLEPALGYPFLPPILATAILVATLVRRDPGTFRDGVPLIVPAWVSGIIILPTITAFYDAFGRGLLPLIAVLIALTATWLGPLLAAGGRMTRWATPLLGLIAMTVFSMMAASSPAYSPSLPQHLNIRHVTDADSGQNRWVFLGQKPFPSAITEIAGEKPNLEELYPWAPVRVPTLAASGTASPPPLFETVETRMDGQDRIVEANLRSQSGATYLELILPTAARVEAVRYPSFDEIAPPQEDSRDDWRRIHFFVVPSDGVQIRLRVPPGTSGDAYLLEASPTLPSGAEAFQNARGEVVPYGEGDLKMTFRHISIGSFETSQPR